MKNISIVFFILFVSLFKLNAKKPYNLFGFIINAPCVINENLKTPYTPYELLDIAIDKLNEKNFCEAANLLATSIKVTPLVDRAFLKTKKFCTARFSTAEGLFIDESYDTAITFYKGFTYYCYDEIKTPEAYFKIADAFFTRILSPEYDQRYTKEAINNFLFFIRNFPDEEKIEEAKEKFNVCYENLSEHELIIGKQYFKFRKYKAALERFKFLCSKFPKSPFVKEAMIYISKCYEKMNMHDESLKAQEIYKKHFGKGE